MQNTPNIESKLTIDALLSMPELHYLLEQKYDLVVSLEQAIVDRKQILNEKQKLLKLMEEKLGYARQMRFGSSNDKQPFQCDFFDEAELELTLSGIKVQLLDAVPAKAQHKSNTMFHAARRFPCAC